MVDISRGVDFREVRAEISEMRAAKEDLLYTGCLFMAVDIWRAVDISRADGFWQMRAEIAEVRAAKEEHRVARERAGQDTRDKVFFYMLYIYIYIYIYENGSSQGQNLALTVLFVPNSPDSGSARRTKAAIRCAFVGAIPETARYSGRDRI